MRVVHHGRHLAEALPIDADRRSTTRALHVRMRQLLSKGTPDPALLHPLLHKVRRIPCCRGSNEALGVCPALSLTPHCRSLPYSKEDLSTKYELAAARTTGKKIVLIAPSVYDKSFLTQRPFIEALIKLQSNEVTHQHLASPFPLTAVIDSRSHTE